MNLCGTTMLRRDSVRRVCDRIYRFIHLGLTLSMVNHLHPHPHVITLLEDVKHVLEQHRRHAVL